MNLSLKLRALLARPLDTFRTERVEGRTASNFDGLSLYAPEGTNGIPDLIRTGLIAQAMLATGLLAGCTVGPDYRTPATADLPGQFVNAPAPLFAADSSEVAWWKLFNDGLLEHLVEQSLQHNRDLQAAKANLAEARALYLESGLSLLPTVTSRASYNEQKRSAGSLNNRAFVPRELKLYSMGFDASWELDFFGRVRRGVEAADDQVAAEEASLRDVEVSLTGEVARNYFLLRGLQNQLSVAKRNAENQAQTLQITQVKVGNGRGTELDTTRAEAQLASTRAGIPPLENAISQAIHRLSVLSGQMPDALVTTLSAEQALPKAPETIRIGDPAQLLRRRPDIRMAERQLAAATAQIGVATADLFPRVTFVGSISLEGNTLTNLVAPGGDAYSIGPRITWAAFDLGRVYARIKAADARAEANLAQYEQTVLNALEETENSLVAYRQELSRRADLSKAAAASAKARELAQLRYQEGISDFLTVLDAEQRLLQDQSQLAQSETAAATALAAVYKALGGGWQTAAQPDNASR